MDEVKDALVQVQLPALLGEVADADRFAPVDGAAVGEELPGNQIEQGGLARTVAADDAHAVVSGDPVGEVAEDGVVPEGLAHVVQLDGLAPQAAGEGRHLEGTVSLRAGLGLQLLIAGNSVLVFGAAGLGAAHDPLVFYPQDGLALALGGLLHLLLLGLQLQVLGVVGLVMADVAVRQLRDAVGHAL